MWGTIRSFLGVKPVDTDAKPLTSEELQAIREILQQYKAHEISNLPRRPTFKEPRSNSGFLCNEEVRKRALQKAKADPRATGGSLSSLIELLLWRYVGSPEDVVEEEDSEV